MFINLKIAEQNDVQTNKIVVRAVIRMTYKRLGSFNANRSGTTRTGGRYRNEITSGAVKISSPMETNSSIATRRVCPAHLPCPPELRSVPGSLWFFSLVSGVIAHVLCFDSQSITQIVINNDNLT